MLRHFASIQLWTPMELHWTFVYYVWTYQFDLQYWFWQCLWSLDVLLLSCCPLPSQLSESLWPHLNFSTHQNTLKHIKSKVVTYVIAISTTLNFRHDWSIRTISSAENTQKTKSIMWQPKTQLIDASSFPSCNIKNLNVTWAPFYRAWHIKIEIHN